jgi:hypothetical protein
MIMVIEITPKEARVILRFEAIMNIVEGEDMLLSTGAKILIKGEKALIKGYAYDYRDVIPYFMTLSLDPLKFARGLLAYLRNHSSVDEAHARKTVAKILEKKHYMWQVESPDSFRTLQHHLIGTSKKTATGRKYSVSSCELVRILDTLETIRDITPKGFHDDADFTDCKGLKNYNRAYNAGDQDKCRTLEYVPIEQGV